MKSTFDLPPSPLQQVSISSREGKSPNVWIKRDDKLLLEAYPGDLSLSGNKWRKLKYNIPAVGKLGLEHILTFGGAHSNHLAAVASMGEIFGFKTYGVVRGEEPENYSPTLLHARRCGMRLHFLSRSEYRLKEKAPALQDLLREMPKTYIIPEGGSNAEAMKGCAELVAETRRQLGGKVGVTWCAACGTGATLAGMLPELSPSDNAMGFSVLKGGFMRDEIAKWLESFGLKTRATWKTIDDQHFGGYAKGNEELVAFINRFREEHGIPLDPIYTGKLLYGLCDRIEKEVFPPGSDIVVIHSGGLQGIEGWNRRFQHRAELQISL